MVFKEYLLNSNIFYTFAASNDLIKMRIYAKI